MRLRTLLILAALAQTTAALADGPRPAAEIAALIEAAEPGSTVVVPPGVYHGSLRITRPIVLDGGGLAVIDGRGATVVVEILAQPVTVRNLGVRGSGERIDLEPAGIRAETGPVVIENNTVTDALFGIDLRSSPGSVVRGNHITGKGLDQERRGDAVRLWWSEGCVVEDNTATRARDMVFWYSRDLIVRNNTVTDSRYGLHFMYSHETVLTGNTLTGNSVGVYLMYSNGITVAGNHISKNRGPSGYGIGLKDCDDIRILDNALMANRVGLYIDNSPSSIDSTGLVASNLIAYNEVGITATPNTHANEITANAFVENEEQVGVHGRGNLTLNRFSKDGVGNFWSDYAGFDRTGDGVGDLAYQPSSLFESLLAREPNLRFFVHSPAQQAVEFTARALPELRPEPKFIDPAPLTARRAPPEVAVPSAADAQPLVLLAVGLLVFPGVLAWLITRDGACRGAAGSARYAERSAAA
jgi:nitrous oxidase accessory protein